MQNSCKCDECGRTETQTKAGQAVRGLMVQLVNTCPSCLSEPGHVHLYYFKQIKLSVFCDEHNSVYNRGIGGKTMKWSCENFVNRTGLAYSLSLWCGMRKLARKWMFLLEEREQCGWRRGFLAYITVNLAVMIARYQYITSLRHAVGCSHKVFIICCYTEATTHLKLT